jgi:hypothetical protein
MLETVCFFESTKTSQQYDNAGFRNFRQTCELLATCAVSCAVRNQLILSIKRSGKVSKSSNALTGQAFEVQAMAVVVPNLMLSLEKFGLGRISDKDEMKKTVMANICKLYH